MSLTWCYGQMKHQLDATLCRFYFCRVTLHVSGANAHHQEYLKLIWWPLVHVLSLQVSRHISLLGPDRVKEWLCRNKICTVLHQAGVSFDLYYDARKHKIKIWCYGLTFTVLSSKGLVFRCVSHVSYRKINRSCIMALITAMYARCV